MKKRFDSSLNAFLIIFSLSLSLFVSGCSSINDEAEKKYHLSYGEIVEHFKKCGIEITSINSLRADVPNAESGFAFTIKGKQIGIYKFNPKFKKQREKLERIAKEGFLYLCAIKYPALVNGPFVMVDYNVNPEEGKIVEAFKSFAKDSSWF